MPKKNAVYKREDFSISFKNKKVAFIGAGQMAEALISGILSSGQVNSQEISASDISTERLEILQQKFEINTSTNNVKAVQGANIIFLSVKPQQAESLLAEIGPYSNEKLIISIMAGITIRRIEDKMPNAKVIRVMPNTPALVGRAVSALAKGTRAGNDDLETARLLLKFVGKAIIIEEELMDAVTALSGSGPAYYYWLTETLVEAGKKMGIEEEKAKMFAKNTFIGAAALLEETNEDPGVLRQRVTSPGGTTEAALNSLKKNEVKDIIIKAVEAAEKKSKELSKG